MARREPPKGDRSQHLQAPAAPGGNHRRLRKSFRNSANEFEHPERGNFRGRERKLYVPADLAGVIVGAFGLDTRPIGKPRRRRIAGKHVEWETLKAQGPRQPADPAGQFPGCFFPPQVAELYNYPAQLDGTDQNIAVFAFNGPPSPDPRGGYKLTSLQTYFEQVLGGKTPTIKDVVVQGPGNDPGPAFSTTSPQATTAPGTRSPFIHRSEAFHSAASPRCVEATQVPHVVFARASAWPEGTEERPHRRRRGHETTESWLGLSPHRSADRTGFRHRDRQGGCSPSTERSLPAGNGFGRSFLADVSRPHAG